VYRHADLQEEIKTCGQSDTPSTSSHDGSNVSPFTTSPIDEPSASAAAGLATPTLATIPSMGDAGAPAGGSGPHGERETIELLIFNDNQRWIK
jgi:hypothetical protein